MFFGFFRFACALMFFSFLFLAFNHFFFEREIGEVDGGESDSIYDGIIQECKQALVGSGVYALSGLKRVSERETVSKGRDKTKVRYWASGAIPSFRPAGWVCVVVYDDRNVIESVSLIFE